MSIPMPTSPRPFSSTHLVNSAFRLTFPLCFPENSFGIWEGTHSPQRFLARSLPTFQNPFKCRHRNNLFHRLKRSLYAHLQLVTLMTLLYLAQTRAQNHTPFTPDINATDSQLPFQPWSYGLDTDLRMSSSTYITSLDNYFQNFLGSFIEDTGLME
jgi:hypothetical protein